MTILGQVTFDPTIDIELRAKIIFVRSGILQIGTEKEPYAKKGIITLYGSRNENTLALDTDVEGGNKMIGNLGKVHMYGKARGFKMTRLFAPANKGDTSITIGKDLDLVAGDQLGLASSSYEPNAGDIVTIGAYTKATGLATLKAPLKFYHWGAAESTAKEYSGVDMRTEAVLLTRNIVVRGNNQDNWGC